MRKVFPCLFNDRSASQLLSKLDSVKKMPVVQPYKKGPCFPFSLTNPSALIISMAHCFLFFLLVVTAIAVASARPFAFMAHTTAIEFHRHGAAHAPAASLSANGMESRIGGAPKMAMHPRRHPFDKSIAGGEVILGGLATAILAAIFCYIRVTRQKDGEEKS